MIVLLAIAAPAMALQAPSYHDGVTSADIWHREWNTTTPGAVDDSSARPTETVASESRVQRVLVIHSYHQGLSWTDAVHAGIRRELRDLSHVAIDTVHLDTKRTPLRDREHFAIDEIKTLLADAIPDVIVVSDNAALDFALQHREDLFPDVPLIFCGINQFEPSMIEGQQRVTGVVETTSALRTVQLARALFPKRQDVFVVAGTSDTAAATVAEVRKALHPIADEVNIHWWLGFRRADLQRALQSLGDDAIVLLVLFNRDADGHFYTYEEAGAMVSEATSAPVFGLWDFYIGTGVVGGYVTSAEFQGRTAGEQANHILKGTPLDYVSVVKASPNVPMFDAQALYRHDARLESLPGSARLSNELTEFRNDFALDSGIAIGVLLLIAIGAWRTTRVFRQYSRNGGQSLARRVELLMSAGPAVLFIVVGAAWSLHHLAEYAEQRESVRLEALQATQLEMRTDISLAIREIQEIRAAHEYYMERDAANALAVVHAVLHGGSELISDLYTGRGTGPVVMSVPIDPVDEILSSNPNRDSSVSAARDRTIQRDTAIIDGVNRISRQLPTTSIIAFDADGTCRAHSTLPSMVGRPMREVMRDRAV
ncbi:MAG: ABC transporter substrate-binding protein, partial [Planctomycetota bacterium]